VMATKPAGGWAWLFPTVGALVGIALARLQLARREVSSDGGSVPVQRAAAVEPAAEQV
jgi:hypothetical protein